MAEAEALTWRELLDRHHSTLVDAMQARIDADLHGAAAEATAIARAEAERLLAEAREEAEAAGERRVAEALQAAEAASESRIAGIRQEAEEDAVRRIAEAREAAWADARQVLAGSLHQAIRRLRQTNGDQRILSALNELSSPWASQSVVLVFENHQARALAARGISGAAVANSEEAQPAAATLAFDIAASPAVLSVIESRDPVVALLSASELSAPLAAALGGDSEAPAYLFPVLVRQSVVAVLVAAGSVAAPQVEVLCDAASMRLEAAAAAPPSPLVQIAEPQTAAAFPSPQGRQKPTWEDLEPDDQRLHLQAQRMARVRTAEIRLYHADALQRGSAAVDIYSALQPQIDAARSEFLDNYLSKSPTMVDYLHLEILNTLAHNDDRLLGPGYPGPMV